MNFKLIESKERQSKLILDNENDLTSEITPDQEVYEEEIFFF